jgi:hypothetical protein
MGISLASLSENSSVLSGPCPALRNGQTPVFPTPAYRQAGLSLFDPIHHNTNKKALEGTFYLRMLGRMGSNHRMEASKAPALPLGYSPVWSDSKIFLSILRPFLVFRYCSLFLA